MSQAILGTKTAEVIYNAKKTRKNKMKVGDVILINKPEPAKEPEPEPIIELTVAKAKKLMPKKPRTEKQKENDKKIGERMKERKRENQLQKEKILTEAKEDKNTQMIKIKAPKKYRKKPVVIQEQDDEEQKSSSDEEIRVLKKNVKKLSQKNDLLNEITKIKNSARSTTPNKNPYDDMLNRYF